MLTPYNNHITSQINKPSKTLMVMGIIGAICFVLFNWVLPSITDRSAAAPVPIQPISKSQAGDAARKFIKSELHSSVSHTLVVFQTHASLNGYLAKEHLLKQYNEKFAKLLPLDYFQVQTTDGDPRFEIDVNMFDGHILGWNANEGNPGSGSKLRSADSVIAMMGYSIDQFAPPASAPNGMIVYESRSERIGQAKLELLLRANNGVITQFRPNLSLPQEYTLWEAKQKQISSYLGLASELTSLIMAGSAVVMAIRHRKTIAFRRGILLASLFTLAYWANLTNMYPGFKAVIGNNPGSEMMAQFNILFTGAIIAFMGIIAYLCFGTGDALWRKSGFPAWPRWQQYDYGSIVLASMKKGYLLFLIFIGFQAVFYFAAEQRFDIWTLSDPADSPYNLLWLWLFPAMAWCAAISEESAYRLFGIALFRRWFRSTLPAVFISSFIWALGHTQYPVYPIYTRLIEVTCLGLLFGYAFLRYGLIAVLFAHAAMDSFYMSLSVMSIGGGLVILAGILYVALPAIIAFMIYLLHLNLRKKADHLPPEAPTG